MAGSFAGRPSSSGSLVAGPVTAASRSGARPTTCGAEAGAHRLTGLPELVGMRAPRKWDMSWENGRGGAKGSCYYATL